MCEMGWGAVVGDKRRKCFWRCRQQNQVPESLVSFSLKEFSFVLRVMGFN